MRKFRQSILSNEMTSNSESQVILLLAFLVFSNNGPIVRPSCFSVASQVSLRKTKKPLRLFCLGCVIQL